MKFTPHAYQDTAIDFSLENEYCALFLDMGLGKTIITLTVLKMLLNNYCVFKPIIIAPKFVTLHTWPTELTKWDHLRGLAISVIAGTPKKRLQALNAFADVYIVSWDNIAWLVELLGSKWNFDTLILDELTKTKNQKSQRFKAVRKIRPKAKRVIGLTGTPAPNGLIDLWAQMYLLDQGKRLHRFIGTYRQMYFHEGRRFEFGGCEHIINKGAEGIIFSRIKDICLSMKATDHLQLPKRTDIIREVVLDDYDGYNAFKREKILELPERQITAFNASSLYTKLLQYANGAVYDDEHNYHVVHNKKLDALVEAVDELQGESVIIFYQFQSDVERIKARLKNAVLFKNVKQIALWDDGYIEIFLAHAAGTGHGVNLQYGGHYIFWYGVPASLELYLQAVTRIDRQGQRFPVFNYLFLVKGTPEYKVYKGLLNKSFTQDQLFEALK